MLLLLLKQSLSFLLFSLSNVLAESRGEENDDNNDEGDDPGGEAAAGGTVPG